ncbi:MAG: hypothetical protein AVDCRST_MAG11-3010, partial [uncultured Gemmatimonadaceae bacterium]
GVHRRVRGLRCPAHRRGNGDLLLHPPQRRPVSQLRRRHCARRPARRRPAHVLAALQLVLRMPLGGDAAARAAHAAAGLGSPAQLPRGPRAPPQARHI